MKSRAAIFTLLILLTLTMGLKAAAGELEPAAQQLIQRPQTILYAGSLAYGERVSSILEADFPVHLWEFEGQAGDVISIAMNTLGDQLDPYLLLLMLDDEEFEIFLSFSGLEIEALDEMAAEFGVLLALNDDRPDSRNALIAAYTLPVNGRYFIAAASCCIGSTFGEYELIVDFASRLEEVAAPEIEVTQSIPPIDFPQDNTPFIPPTTRIINADLSARYLLDVSGAGESVVFSDEITGFLERPFRENDVLVLEPTGMAPYGLLRRIVSVTFAPGEIILTTQQASLEEAIYNGEVHAEITITPDGSFVVESAQRSILARRSGLPAADSFSIPFLDEVILPGVTISGDIELEPSFEFDMVIEHFDLKQLTIKNTTRQHGQITLEASAAFGGKAEMALQPLGDIDPVALAVIDTDFTIWLTPELDLYLGLNGCAEAGVSVTVNQEVTYNAGLIYEDEQLSLLADSSGDKVWVDDPVFTTEAAARAYLKPVLAMVILGGTGPYIAAEGYMRFAADPCVEPWWIITGGVGGMVGARVGIFSFELIDEEWPIVVAEWPLEEAKEPAPVTAICTNGPSPIAPTPAPKSFWQNLQDIPLLAWLVIVIFVAAVLRYIFNRL